MKLILSSPFSRKYGSYKQHQTTICTEKTEKFNRRYDGTGLRINKNILGLGRWNKSLQKGICVEVEKQHGNVAETENAFSSVLVHAVDKGLEENRVRCGFTLERGLGLA